MDKKAVIEIVVRFRQILESQGVQPYRILLYGSYASGTHREESDIDIVVISDDFTGKSHWERVKILSEAIYAVFSPIEAVAMTRKEWDLGTSMIAEFARSGEVLYAS